MFGLVPKGDCNYLSRRYVRTRVFDIRTHIVARRLCDIAVVDSTGRGNIILPAASGPALPPMPPPAPATRILSDHPSHDAQSPGLPLAHTYISLYVFAYVRSRYVLGYVRTSCRTSGTNACSCQVLRARTYVCTYVCAYGLPHTCSQVPSSQTGGAWQPLQRSPLRCLLIRLCGWAAQQCRALSVLVRVTATRRATARLNRHAAARTVCVGPHSVVCHCHSHSFYACACLCPHARPRPHVRTY